MIIKLLILQTQTGLPSMPSQRTYVRHEHSRQSPAFGSILAQPAHTIKCCNDLLAKREVSFSLGLPQGFARSLVSSQATTDSAGLLGTEIQRNVLLALVEDPQLVPLR